MTEGGTLKILCIEDNPMNWRLVQRLLGQAGYEMHWAEEGLKGYDMALGIKPNLVLLDINLPGLSGFEIASKFRQTPELRDIPLIALTAKTQKSDRETALVAGCDGFIPKPLDPFTFVKQVEGYLGGQRERIEQAREGVVLRQLNVQVLEHLEAQLKEAQEANSKLMEAQQALESRNRSLSQLLALSQGILREHDPKAILLRILDQVRTEVRVQKLYAYRLHVSGGYWEGQRWNGQAFEEAPILPKDHPFVLQAHRIVFSGVLHGDSLKTARAWEEGLPLDFWKPGEECSLLVMKDRQEEGGVLGFWAFARDGADPFQPLEVELISLHASIATVSLENAELIVSLNESSRALASSYERMEGAFQDIQNAKADLSRRDRQVILENLFLKITQRLEVPVYTLDKQTLLLGEMLAVENGEVPQVPEVPQVLGEIRSAVAKIDGLLRALSRRVGREGTKPEWIDLHELLQQELELLGAEEVIPVGTLVETDLQASIPLVFGVYNDFASLLLNLTQHALGGPTPSPTLKIRSWREGDEVHIETLDEGGPIPTRELEMAFEPFSELHQQAVLGVRMPGPSLAVCKQVLTSYNGGIEVRNEGEGTLVSLYFLLK